MKVTAYSSAGEAKSAKVALPDDVFDGVVNEDALHQVVTAILANQRQGTAATKTRGKVRGGSRKPWRQKGTGRARAGTIRSPIWRGGGIVFGPEPRSYQPGVPRKLKRLATRSALNARAREGALGVVDALDLDAPRTRALADLKNNAAEGGNFLLLTAGNKTNLYLSGRNLPGCLVKPWGEASAYDILWADFVLVEDGALDGKDSDENGGDE